MTRKNSIIAEQQFGLENQTFQKNDHYNTRVRDEHTASVHIQKHHHHVLKNNTVLLVLGHQSQCVRAIVTNW